MYLCKVMYCTQEVTTMRQQEHKRDMRVIHASMAVDLCVNNAGSSTLFRVMILSGEDSFDESKLLQGIEGLKLVLVPSRPKSPILQKFVAVSGPGYV